MIYISVFILAIVQGITEFLPISSSGHLVLTHHFMGDAKNLTALGEKRLDIAVHIGTLLAVILYFRTDFIDLIMGGLDILRLKFKTEKAHKSLMIAIATIPVLICGFIMFAIDITVFDSITIIAWMTLIFGIVLYIADKQPERETTEQNFTWKTALFYGVMQCIALIPGVSRSGITMTSGRFLGHSRILSARFSMLMGMTTIAAAGCLTGVSVFKDQTITSDFLITLAIGIAMSFIMAYVTILFMMRWLKSSSFTPFVVYRILLGGGLLILIYGGFLTGF